ncbi:MAG: GNAT family N-acetyltransferase [Aquamicrobium sp.]|uniref:GNAT family N-acetyltransferase n=1 Tax=Mesorhizobium sp. Pch-S TaxID=2082387 RepID=UPI00101280D1|nr:GNAT family N-acetyltransferase [Mesorhizobium sp. Pch-S]MBR2686787.1 GNAT family N-acetyltransferase [Aquamicrobium sp.]QAZ46580.1 GNAT family N-acetyltransferase [Mesorhizobium sp. Pch-S]
MVELLVTYLDMTASPSGTALASPGRLARLERENLSPADYLDLYRAVGASLDWDQRLRMPGEQLAILLASPSTWLNVLRVDGVAAGFCEFNGVGEPVVELAHFGLAAAFQGRGLGPYLLDSSLRAIWSQKPQRVWLHTDTNDHPKALSVYLRAGFAIRERRMESFPD